MVFGLSSEILYRFSQFLTAKVYGLFTFVLIVAIIMINTKTKPFSNYVYSICGNAAVTRQVEVKGILPILVYRGRLHPKGIPC